MCIECALKVSTAFSFIEFCSENQRLLHSPHFNDKLLVEATDNPAPHQLDYSHLEVTQPHSLSPPAIHQQSASARRRKISSTSSSPTLKSPATLVVAADDACPIPMENGGEVDPMDEEHELHDPSSMLECQLEDEESAVVGGAAQEVLPPGVDGIPPGNPYRCTVCFREFGKKANVLSHFQTQHTHLEVPSAWKYEIEPAKCPLCGQLVECLLAHLEFHAGKRTFKCDSCEWAFYSRNYLGIHTNKLHKADAAVDAKPDRFHCKLCPEGSTVCRDYDDLVAHHRQWHLNEMRNKMETCGVCQKETRYLKQHMEKAHGSAQGQQGQFHCHICDKSYAKLRYLRAHLTTAHVEPQLAQQQPQVQPQELPATQLMEDKQQQHQQSQQQKAVSKRPRPPGGPVRCVKCQMQFGNNRTLNMHIQRYHCPPGPGVTNRENHTVPLRAEVSVTAIPTNGEDGTATKKRRRESVSAASALQRDLWNNPALTGMLANMFAGHGPFET